MKITKFMLTLALVFAGVGGANAEEVKIPIELTGAADGVTVTPINPTTLEPLDVVPEHIYAAKFKAGGSFKNVFQYTNMSITDVVSQGCDRIVVEFGGTVDNVWQIHGYGARDNYEGIGGKTSHTIMLDGTNPIDDFTVFNLNWGDGTNDEIIITAAYFYKPNNTKTLEVNLSALPTSSEHTTWSWDSGTSTGTFAWSDTSYNSTELFGAGNYSAYTTLNLETASGTADHFRIIIKFTNGAAQVTINPVATGTQSITLTDYVSVTNLANVETIRLSGASDKTGDIIVSKVYLEGPDVTYIEATTVYEAPTGTTDIKDLTGYTNDDWKNSVTYPKELAVQGAAFGNGDGSNESQHVDIEGYDYICFEVTTATATTAGFRVWIWDDINSSVKTLYVHPIADYATANWTEYEKITGTGTYVAKISGYKYLKGVKAENDYSGVSAATVSMAWVCKGAVPTPYKASGKYLLVGEATGSVSLTAALADANATCYDATGVVGSGVELNPANPNALFLANAGKVTNANNVIVAGTCANLVLTDNHPFKAPVDFTATAASYTTTINAEAGAGTLCLPFAAAIPEGVKAYKLAYTSGAAATATPVVETTIGANTPVLLNGSGEKTFSGSGAVSASATNKYGALTGVFEATTVPAGSYVLQKATDGLGFYKVADGSTITAKPFRAYLTAQTYSSRINIIYDEANGISTVEAQPADAEAIYSLNGVRVNQPVKGIYVKNGKKFVVK